MFILFITSLDNSISDLTDVAGGPDGGPSFLSKWMEWGGAGRGPQTIQPSRSKLILTLARRNETDKAGSRSLMRRGEVDIR